MSIVRCVAAAAAVLAWSTSAAAQTADEVVEKSLAALGGRAAHAKIKTRAATGTITLQTPAGDIPGTIELANALPNKLRTVIKADLSAFGAGPLLIDQRFDGQAGYVVNTLQGNSEATGNTLANMRNNGFPHSFMTYKEQGIKASLQAKDKIGDREMLVVLFEPSSGSTIRHYIDAQTYLPARTVLKIVAPEVGEFEQTNDLSDYREQDGVKMPFKVSASSSVQSYTIEIAKVVHNTPLDDKQFMKP